MKNQTSGKILIADDNPDDLKLMSTILGDSNYDIRIARDGYEALESIQADMPDLIILDVQIPRMDGYELCRRLKKDERYKDVPIIFICALDESFNKAIGFQSGAVDYIVKPFETEEVKARVKTYIEHYMYKREIKDLHQELERRIKARTNQLREREAILNGFINGSEDAICIRDKERRLILWNQKFANGLKATCGVDVKVGMRAEDYVPKEIFAQFEEQRKKLYPAVLGKPTQAEYAFPGKDGKISYFDVRWTSVLLDGEVIGVAEVSRDITEQKEAEERYRTVADFTYDWEYWQGMNGEFNYVSPSCERISGYSPKEFMQRPVLLEEIVIKEDSPQWQGRACNIENNFINKPESFLFRIQRKDGEKRWIEHVCQPVFDSDGTSLGIRASNRDITQRKLAEENLQRSEQQLRLIADSLPVFISYVDSTECYTFNNKGYLDFFNLTTDQIVGMSIKDVLGPETYKHVRPHIKNALEGEQAWFEVEILRSGKKHQIESAYIPDTDKTGNVNGFFVLATDVTTRKNWEAELQRHREELAHVSRLTSMGELTASMAHELNQPLTAILINAQAARRFLEHDTVDIEEIKEILDDIIGDDRRAGQVIKRLRGFLKRGELYLKTWGINEVIQEVFTLVHSDAVIRNVSVHLELQEELPLVLGDRIQIQQVLLNLIINGLDAMVDVHPESRNLIIKTENDAENSVTISVGDSGTGIQPDQMQQIFEPFHTTKADGMGIGLSINRSIIQGHNGELWAENNTNQGATFFFTLPIASVDIIDGG